jgi:hypothetical protein
MAAGMVLQSVRRLDQGGSLVTSINPTHSRHLPRLLSKEHSARPVDWVWQTAHWILSSKTKCFDGGKWLRLTLMFIRALARCEADANRDAAYRKLAKEMPGIYWAWYWHTAADQSMRWTLEAYLVAGVTATVAAAKCGMSDETGFLYAKVFFDVEGRLDQPGFVLNEVIGRQAHRSLSENDQGTIWKLIGLSKGALFLDSFILQDFVRKPVQHANELDRACEDIIRDTLRCRAIVAAQVLSPARNPELIMVAHAKLRDLAREEGSLAASAPAQDAYSIAQTLGFATEFGGPAEAPQGMSASEPRATETLAKTFGIKLATPYVDADLVYPEGGEQAVGGPAS